MVLHWSLNDCKSPQVSRTFLSILTNVKNAVVCMVSTYPLIFKSSNPFTNLKGTAPSAPVTISITVIFMFYNFFLVLSQGLDIYLSFRFLLIFLCGLPRQQSPLSGRFSFWLIISRSDRLAKISSSVCISKSQKSLCVSFSRTDSGLYIYHLFMWSNFDFLHKSQWMTLPTQSSLVLYSFCANLQHSLILWLFVSSLSPHNLHLLFCWVLSIFAFVI